MTKHSNETANGRAAIAREGTPFLCCAQAAFYLGMSETTLRKHRAAGTGPRVRSHSRHLRYHIDDLDAWSQESSEGGK